MTAATGAAAHTLAEHAEFAEQAVRTLIHRSRPSTGEDADPAEVATVLAALAALTGMLPQLLDQLARWLLDQHRAGRLRADFLAPQADAGQAVHATAAALAHADACLQRASHAIDTAHQHAAHLASTNHGEDDDDSCDDGRGGGQ